MRPKCTHTYRQIHSIPEHVATDQGSIKVGSIVVIGAKSIVITVIRLLLAVMPPVGSACLAWLATCSITAGLIPCSTAAGLIAWLRPANVTICVWLGDLQVHAQDSRA